MTQITGSMNLKTGDNDYLHFSNAGPGIGSKPNAVCITVHPSNIRTNGNKFDLIFQTDECKDIIHSLLTQVFYPDDIRGKYASKGYSGIYFWNTVETTEEGQQPLAFILTEKEVFEFCQNLLDMLKHHL